MPSQLLLTVAAVVPIVLVIFLMIGRKWSGSEAGIAGWLSSVVIALIFFGGNLNLIWVAFGKGFFLALFVLYIIWMALLLYHVANDGGAIQAIGQELPHMSEGRGSQALLLAWVFASFLQGASGFGVPAAVVAPLLVGLGFAPTVAVVIGLIGHAWAVTYGSLGSSFFALIAASGVPGELLAGPVAIYMGICCLLCGLIVWWSAGGAASLWRRWPTFLLTGLTMVVAQYAIAVAGFWSLASFGASLAGLIVMIAMLHLRRGPRPIYDRHLLMQGFWPYVIMTIIILLGNTILESFLSGMTIQYDFAAVSTTRGFSTPAEAGRAINLFGHPGALLLYSSILVFGWYKWRGTLPTAIGKLDGWAIMGRTIKKSRKSTVSIIALVAMGTTMQHAGMTQILADGLSNSGGVFPVLSPFIGALGAFMTGSNTNSNVVFGELQRQTALAIQLPVALILAAQTAGGAIGSAFAPAKIIVGVSTVEGAEEGKVMRSATMYGLFIIAVIGLVTLFAV